jgi:hypothetical protein
MTPRQTVPPAGPVPICTKEGRKALLALGPTPHAAAAAAPATARAKTGKQARLICGMCKHGNRPFVASVQRFR